MMVQYSILYNSNSKGLQITQFKKQAIMPYN